MSLNKVEIMAISGDRERGLTVQYMVVPPSGSGEPKTIGSINLAISHPKLVKETFESLAKYVEEIFEAKGYLNAPTLVMAPNNIEFPGR